MKPYDYAFNPWTLCKGELKRTSEANWRLPVKWNKTVICNYCGSALGTHKQSCAIFTEGTPLSVRRPRVFCASIADWLDDEVPIEWLADLLKLIHDTPNLDWLLLSKRPENWFRRVEQAHALLPVGSGESVMVAKWLGSKLLDYFQPKPPANVWIGTSVEDQQRADERIPELLKMPAKVRFLSCEPLLGPVDLRLHSWDDFSDAGHGVGRQGKIHWVICGESGPNARPMHPDWARSLRDQCQVAGVPFFFKQWGEYVDLDKALASQLKPKGDASYLFDDHTEMWRVGKHAAGRLLDGREWNEFPKSL